MERVMVAAWRERWLRMGQDVTAFRRTCFRLYSLFWWREHEVDRLAGTSWAECGEFMSKLVCSVKWKRGEPFSTMTMM